MILGEILGNKFGERFGESFNSLVGTTFPASALPFWRCDAKNVESHFLGKSDFSSLRVDHK